MNELMYKTNFLNSLFTEKDFKFIDSIDKELENLHTKINIQEEKRDTIVKFINNINDLLEQDNSSNKNELSSKHTNANQIFEIVNENINLLYSLDLELKELNNLVINFLIFIESNPKEDYSNDEQLQKIKFTINKYSNMLSESNNKILVNDIKIDLFIKNTISKTFLSDLDFYESNKENNDTNAENKEDGSDDMLYKEDVKEFDNSILASNFEDKNILLISEKENKVFLPYKVSEVNEYINQYPNSYSSFEDVIRKEFVLPLSYYIKHPVLARFREAYSLIRDREAKSVVDALKYAVDLMFKYELNPAIVAACKTQDQLENYLECLKANKLDNFNDFEIRFEINPL